jgi:hypothetical protein
MCEAARIDRHREVSELKVLEALDRGIPVRAAVRAFGVFTEIEERYLRLTKRRAALA